MRPLLLLTLLFLPTPSFAQSATLGIDDFAETLTAERAETDAEFLDPNESPLDPRAQGVFDGLAYFEPDPAFAVVATFERTPDARPFDMATTDGATRPYVSYGVFHFMLDGTAYTLHGYHSVDAPRDSLFVPFKDATNGAETYGGGRYLDVPIPGSEETVLDFNRAYNPYCAFSLRYSCPLPPSENWLDVRIEAGEQAPPPALAEATTASLPDEWLRVEEPADGYAAWFPFEPQHATQIEATEAGPMEVRIRTVGLGERELAVLAMRLPEAARDTVPSEELLDFVADGIARNSEDTIRMLVPITLKGYSGRALHLGYDENQAYWRLYFREGVLYQLVTIGAFEKTVRERFFEGFSFLPSDE